MVLMVEQGMPWHFSDVLPVFPVAPGEHQFKFSAEEPVIPLKGFRIHVGREHRSMTLANPAWRVYGSLDSLSATCGIELQDSMEACMNEPLSWGFSGFHLQWKFALY